MNYKEYIKQLDSLYKVGNTTEHSFRGTLAGYLQSLFPKLVVTNEPRRIDCGAPDYVITSKDEPIAFLEAKDINDSDLDGRKEHKEQFERYKSSLNRIIFTDYLDFHLYIEGQFVNSVRIAETHGNRIVGISENEAKFNEIISILVSGGRQKITSSSSLARQMAAKAHLLAETIKLIVQIDGEKGKGEISSQLRAFRRVLIHDLTAEEFADIYAQTIAYGMFTARLYDTTPEDFSRQEAAELIPHSNPFLRRIFQTIAVFDLDSSIAWIVDDLAAMFAATDAEKIMRSYGRHKLHSDPIVHFYEDFLAEYDPKLRKSRGVWYTPSPVVKFIVNSVDEILQKEFGLARGLADDSTITVNQAIVQSRDKRTVDGLKHKMVDVPRVQILDPATGTGTFLAEVIQKIHDKFIGLEGLWPSYVEKSLIPRIHGFEILMASYTIAHLKLSYTLRETGYTNQTDKRLNIFLTNSLEEATPRADDLFAQWLSDEADAASKVKLDTPVMICLGNPPYSVSSQNNRTWIKNLIADYKKNLSEKNIQPLSDDYIKFIRLAQDYVERTGEGIMAYISNNSFLDGRIHREMRHQLLLTYDDIYILNLHGSARKNEISPDGSKDENVFDIMQGVSINIFIRKPYHRQGKLGKIHYGDLWGMREDKYKWLDCHSIVSNDIFWQELQYSSPYYFFIPKDYGLQNEYEKGVKLNELMKVNACGIVSSRDSLLVHFINSSADSVRNDFYSLSESDFRQKYNIEDSCDWKYIWAKADCPNSYNENIAYRPFDNRLVLYSNKSKGIVQRPRYEIMRHIINRNNISILVCKQQSTFDFQHIFATKFISDKCTLSSQTKEAGYQFPLYLYTEDFSERFPNLNSDEWQKFNTIVGYEISPDDLLSYIYGILHSPSYRKRYKEFLKVDFPHIPLPKDAAQFCCLAEKGAELMNLHIMECATSWPMIISFPIAGDNIIEKVSYVEGKVFINSEQYFGNVSELAWTFFIGGYQPAQKWLKDRKGRILDYQDILHYGHIIYALQETDRLMKKIDELYII